MAQSLSKLYIHIIFHIKNNDVKILPENETELYAYIGGIIKATSSFPIKINGTENHLHILSTMSKNISLADFVEEIKRNSSRWIKTKGEHYQRFAWQSGYAGYSVSLSKVATVERYIERQKEHHKQESFQDEYKKFLEEYGTEYNDNYLWT
jgi:REP element-mobilizing transposase RayT